MMSIHCAGRAGLATLAVLAFLGSTSSAQYAERPRPVNAISKAIDASGRSIKNPRVRAVHTTDPALQGGTAWFINRDPFLAYQLGRNLNFREFRSRDGVFSEFHENLYQVEVGGVGFLGGPMEDGQTAKITANNHTSCSGCHNIPYGNAGGGTNFAKDSGRGRNTPHYYGAGIMEMLAIQVRTDLMLQLDTNSDGWVDGPESAAAPSSIFIEPKPRAPLLNFGDPHINPNSLEPRLNQIMKVWYGCEGYIPGAEYFGDGGSDRYNFEMVVWGWGQLQPENALNPTNRTFFWDPMIAHSGLEAFDPSTLNDPDLDGVSEPTLAGAVQFPATHLPPDRGYFMDPLGFSRDDPDDDGHLNEISEGDLDLAEWFMLNAPRPAFAGTQSEYNAGLALMNQMNCTSCHVADWLIKGKDANYAGDRRLFDFEANWNDSTKALEGKLVPLYTKVGQDYVRNFDSFLVEGLFTDLRHHDMGPAFTELGYDGNLTTKWRTPPLWGVGSGFPWGHDGASLSMRDAILRHGGEGEASRQLFEAANPASQESLISFLDKLVLYDVESLPADINGDSRISSNFVVSTVDTGVERFNAEWLFRRPLRIQGMVTPSKGGAPIRSYAGINIEDAYGLNLPYRQDSDADGWPDVWDQAPNSQGYRDGVNN